VRTSTAIRGLFSTSSWF